MNDPRLRRGTAPRPPGPPRPPPPPPPPYSSGPGAHGSSRDHDFSSDFDSAPFGEPTYSAPARMGRAGSGSSVELWQIIVLYCFIIVGWVAYGVLWLVGVVWGFVWMLEGRDPMKVKHGRIALLIAAIQVGLFVLALLLLGAAIVTFLAAW